MRYSNYSPTSNLAIGNVAREQRRMILEAKEIRRKYLRGFLTAEEEADARQRFRGIYRPLLEDVLKP